jgi:hypothetical protein
MKFFSDIRLLILAIWLGAAVFFIFVAQGAFAVLPQREMAGAVVNRSLATLNYGGLAIALIMIATSFLGSSRIGGASLWIERVLIGTLGAACAIGQFVIGFWLASIRSQMGGPIDQVAPDDPLRLQFNDLHMWAQWILFAGMIAALIAFFVISARRFDRVQTAGKPDVYDFSKEFKV